MDLTSSSHTASLSPTPSSFIHSLASLPTAISSPQNSISKDNNTCYITDIDYPWLVHVPVIALVVLVILGILSFVFAIVFRYKVYELEENVSRLRFEKLDDSLEQLRNHESKIRKTLFEDQFQQDAPELVQIRELQNMTIVFERGAMIHIANRFEAAKREAYEILRQKFAKRYEVETSLVKRKRHWGFGPAPKYSRGNRRLMTDLMDVDIYNSL
ncbi:hypothetical protein EAF00_008146 [Botryotinia globosa]|nr:hypothetical protein EAF00_008146 [Botryotinia globosa]